MITRFGMTAESRLISNYQKNAAEKAHSLMTAKEKKFQQRLDNQIINAFGLKPRRYRYDVVDVPNSDLFRLTVSRADLPKGDLATEGETARLDRFFKLMESFTR